VRRGKKAKDQQDMLQKCGQELAKITLWLSEVRQENAFTGALLRISASEPTASLVLSKSSVWGEVLKVIVPAG
jgi:hypothetical protein